MKLEIAGNAQPLESILGFVIQARPERSGNFCRSSSVRISSIVHAFEATGGDVLIAERAITLAVFARYSGMIGIFSRACRPRCRLRSNAGSDECADARPAAARR